LKKKSGPSRDGLSCGIWILIWGGVCALHAGEVRGRVSAERTPAKEPGLVSRTIIQRYAERRPGHDEEHVHTHAQTTAIVYLVGVSDSTQRKARLPVIMDQQHRQFIPHVLPIIAGTTVRFMNSEGLYHNVFSLSRAKSFNLGRYPKGQYREVLFDKPGVVSVYCDIHTQMNAFIIVLPTDNFAVADAEGNFSLANIPAGAYEIRVWQGRGPEQSQKIVIRDHETVEVNFIFP